MANPNPNVNTNPIPNTNSNASENHPHKKGIKIGLLITFIFVLILVGILIWLFFNPRYGTLYSLNEDAFSLGSTLNVLEGDVIKFNFNNKECNLTIDSILESSIQIDVLEGFLNINLVLEETQEGDLDGDKNSDFKITLNDINNGKASIFIQKLEEKVCEENWICTYWGECINEIQKRNCDDYNNCGTFENEPLTEQECSI